MLFVPEHCGHGYQTLVDGTEMHYMTSQVYTPSACRGARYNDPAFRIQWPLPPTAVSDQDRAWPLTPSKESQRNLKAVLTEHQPEKV
jgi:dTDP-4-dehydrorhamnose 3,5-epimerase